MRLLRTIKNPVKNLITQFKEKMVSIYPISKKKITKVLGAGCLHCCIKKKYGFIFSDKNCMLGKNSHEVSSHILSEKKKYKTK